MKKKQGRGGHAHSEGATCDVDHGRWLGTFTPLIRNPSWLIPPATYGVTSGPPEVDHSGKRFGRLSRRVPPQALDPKS